MSSDTSPSSTSEATADDDRPAFDEMPPDPEIGRYDTAHWSNIFPFDEPYANQKAGIKSIIETSRHHGFSLIEGACGTGKTLMALTAALSLVRHPESKIERILVVTSVKQQMSAFETDIKQINEAAENNQIPIKPISGTTLVGKGDICPYSSAGDMPPDDIYEKCQSYRSDTEALIESEGDSPVSNALSLVADAEHSAKNSPKFDGVTAPFPRRPLDYGNDTLCPFYAQYKADDIVDEQSIPTEGRMLDRNALRREAVNYGTCPHTTMIDQINSAEVIVGNYYHIFDSLTRDVLTDDILDEETFLIVDESHMLVEKVRDLLSDSTTHTGLTKASDECNQVIDYLTGADGPSYQNLAREILDKYTVNTEDIEHLQMIANGVSNWVNSRVISYINDNHPDKEPPYIDLYGDEIPLRDPDIPREDDLTQWLSQQGYHLDVLKYADEIGEVVGDIIGSARERLEDKTGDGVKHTPSAGRLLHSWHTNNNEEFFREIRLQNRGHVSEEYDVGSWKNTHKARLWLNNCIPSGKIASQLNKFGAGVLMSATLAPLDVYHESVGLDFLTDRPTNTEMFSMTFPDDNRDSLAVDLPPFTYDNRGTAKPVDGSTRDPDENAVRDQYATAMKSICIETPGNVLLVLPSYAECAWATAELSDYPEITKPILCDESSSDAETTALKQDFFNGAGKILVTSARGTLTEGIDYAGDRLDAVAVIGVPIISTSGVQNTAINTAYEERYGDGAGFVYAFTVPAVWKARQALGRVIRGDSDIGTRILLDGRYTQQSSANGKVYPYIPDEAYDEYTELDPDALEDRLSSFWASHSV